MDFKSERMLRVTTGRTQTKENYDRLSKFYDYFEGIFEKKAKNCGLTHLNVKSNDVFLEIGFGTGHCIAKVAKSVGSSGKVYGIDISTGMRDVTENRLKRTGLLERVDLYCGDALKMPYTDEFFDVVFMSFTLELFDTPEIPFLLREIKRVLKHNARIGIVSLSEEDSRSLILKLYKWAHKRYPKVVDCRPIYLEQLILDAGFNISFKKKLGIMGLPVEVIIGRLIPGGK